MFSAGSSTSGSSVAKQLSTYIESIPGSPSYWWVRKRDVEAMVNHKKVVSDELPIAFSTGSMAEFHWRHLHKVLHDILLKWGLFEEAECCGFLARGESVPVKYNALLRNILRKYTSFVNVYFTIRTRAWFTIVLKGGLGITDYWYRFEFAKSRGAIHFHSLIYATDVANDIHSKLNRCLTAANFASLEDIEDEVAVEIAEYLRSRFISITALHPAGRQRTYPVIPCDTPWYQMRTK